MLLNILEIVFYILFFTLPYYMNIKRYINQHEFRSFSNKLSVDCLSPNIYLLGKMKLNCVKTCRSEAKLN